jgi:hypothetical protein
MQIDRNLEKLECWSILDQDIRELLLESYRLAQMSSKWKDEFHDYSFIVFPAAKAYEGYLKKLFLDMGFITKEDYWGKRFRIGKALNPSLEKRLRRKESVYDKIVEFCGDSRLADELWDVWKNSRNLIFHWFPDEKNNLNYNEAIERLQKIVDAFDNSYRVCRIR